jgi:hypothetical protein
METQCILQSRPLSNILQDLYIAYRRATRRDDGILLSRVREPPSFPEYQIGLSLTTNTSGFECKGQNYCAKSFNTISTMTYVDATLSTQRKIYGITASPIQIRFKAAQSTIVPVPTDSLSLPRRFLYTREKIGIGIGVPIAVALLTIGFFWWRRSRVRRVRTEAEPLISGSVAGSGSESESLPEDMPPPYFGPAAGSAAAGVDGGSMLERLTGGGKRPS